MALTDYSTTPSSNASKPGIDLSEGMLPGLLNNSIRQIMADIASWLASNYRNMVDQLTITYAGNDALTLRSDNERKIALRNAAGGLQGTLSSNATQCLIIRDNGSVDVGRFVSGAGFQPRVLSKSLLPAASLGAGVIIYCTDESGGAVPIFSDGTVWRRMTDRAVVS